MFSAWIEFYMELSGKRCNCFYFQVELPIPPFKGMIISLPDFDRDDLDCFTFVVEDVTYYAGEKILLCGTKRETYDANEGEFYDYLIAAMKRAGWVEDLPG